MKLNEEELTNQQNHEPKVNAFNNLVEKMNNHPFWRCKLLFAISAKHLTFEDYQILFSEYFYYSKNFTRYLSGLLINLENDLLRSRLTENLWEEGGGAKPEERHAELFRKFLTNGLKLDLANISPSGGTRDFVNSYLNFCKNEHALESSAFLAIGTEAIVARLYGLLSEGLSSVGLNEDSLHFFHLHMECDDEHAETLCDIMGDFKQSPSWFERSWNAIDHALNLRLKFFDHLYELIQQNRVKKIVSNVQSRKSLAVEDEKDNYLFSPSIQSQESIYSNINEKHNINFSVSRAPFPAEILDARVVRIPPGKCNERHKHAHESIFYIINGKASVQIDKEVINVTSGDMTFVPRWCIHQTTNVGDEELIILAITDFYFTGKTFIGNYNSTARMKKD